jgi:putative endonuclease
MATHRIALGRRGEELAAAYLLGLGLRIRQRNVRTSAGEIDLVATTGDGQMVFVEVRTRTRGDGPNPLDAVDARKQKQVRRTVQSYLDAIGYGGEHPVRIDVIGVTLGESAAFLRHIPDAF